MEVVFDNISGLSENSRKLFQTKLTYWTQWFIQHGKGDFREFLRKPYDAFGILQQSPISHTNSNYHLFLSAVIAVFYHNVIPKGVFKNRKEQDTTHALWLELQKQNAAPLRQHYIENKPTERQRHANIIVDGAHEPEKTAVHISWQNIIDARNKLPSGSLERLLFFMYTAIPPVRADYYSTECVLYPSEPTQLNYILIKSLKDMKLVIRDFKTAKLYKEISQALPESICDEIVASLSQKPRKWLFITESGEPFDRKRFSEWSSRTLSKNIGSGHLTINIIRHLYISSHIDFNKSSKELTKIGKAMGHNISMQKGYQWTNPDNS